MALNGASSAQSGIDNTVDRKPATSLGAPPVGPGGIPPAEVDVTVELVRALLAEQHPDLADRELVLLNHGWDNTIVQAGADLVVRLPRRQIAAELVAHEHRWLPGLASGLPIPVAAPVRVGRPGPSYPWPWSVCPWFEGEVAADGPLADPVREADRLGGFLHAFHRPAPPEAPHNPYRGQHIAELVPRMRATIARLGLPSDQLVDLIERLAQAPSWNGPAVWLHGDLHTGNLIVADGQIVAVLDFGDLTAGDPAVDLAIAWMLFESDDRQRFRVAAGGGIPIDDATWDRARLWGIHFALIYLAHSAASERFARMGEQLLKAATADCAMTLNR